MGYYRRLLKYAKPYKPQIMAAAFCILLVAGATLLIAPLAGFVFKNIEEKNIFWLNLGALGVIGLYLLKGIFTYGQEYLSYYVVNRSIIDFRNKLYEHLQDLSLDFYSKWHTGELVSRAMNDIGVIQGVLLSSFIQIVPHSILLTGLLVYIFYLNWKLSLLTLIALPLIIQVIRIFAVEIRQISEGVQQKSADITTHLQETISQIKIVKSFSMEKKETEKFKEKSNRFFDMAMRAVQILATQNPIIALLQATAVVAIVWFGGLQIIQGRMTLAQLAAFATALGIMTDPGNTLSKSYAVLQQGAASLKRIFEIMDTKPRVQEEKNAIALPPISGKVEFKNVSFAYEAEKVLKDINLKVEAGEIIALVGRTGAGKSTLVSLLLRFYDPISGEILIDGYDIKKVKIDSLRKQIAVVPQEITLFSGTIKENIAYGKGEASDFEIVQTAKVANAHTFIRELPSGYETQVGERGEALSGGERQRIAIARALLRNPKILILDEATSSLDPETEALIQEALGRLMAGRTTFIIAHRLYSVEHADRIIVLDEGSMVESGTHQELLKQGGLYKKLYEIQFRKLDSPSG